MAVALVKVTAHIRVGIEHISAGVVHYVVLDILLRAAQAVVPLRGGGIGVTEMGDVLNLTSKGTSTLVSKERLADEWGM